MANTVTPTNIDSRRLVTATSRYADSTIIYYGDENRLTFPTWKREDIPETANDLFTVITPGTEYRPDLVSREAYGTVDFWWRIMVANNIWDVWEFKSGLTIRLPDSLL
jgi:hypothetical protein